MGYDLPIFKAMTMPEWLQLRDAPSKLLYDLVLQPAMEKILITLHKQDVEN